MKVVVIGTGHVGLVTCVVLAHLGHQVAGTDSDGEKIALLQNGIPPFYEPGLEEHLSEGTASGRLSFHPEINDVVPGAEVVIISVGTPPRVDGEASLFAVERSALEFDVVSNPEFLREGRAIQDTLEPDRILVGAETPGAFEAMRRLYAPLIANGVPLIETDVATAELAKHACNA